MKRYRVVLARWLDAHSPTALRCARKLKGHVAILIRKLWVRARAAACGLCTDPHKTCWVSPQAIDLTIFGPDDERRPSQVRGRIKGGDWDLHTMPFEDMEVVRALKDHFINGKPWEDTVFYRNTLTKLSQGEVLWGCLSKQDLDGRCKHLESLFEDIKNNGYKSQFEIRLADGLPDGEDEITVHVDRSGQFLLADGRHRLAMAKICGIDRIPVKVCIRHSKWHNLRLEIIDYARRHYGGKVYQPLTHPDFQDIPSSHDESRFEIITPHLPETKGALLDIGANWGYFCFRLEELGFECYAVESDPINVYFLRKLKEAQKRNFQIIAEPVFDYHQMPRFDVVLALNIFHHFLKTRHLYNNMATFLQNLDTNLMFFEPHLPSEPQMKGAYRNYEPQEFADFVLKHSKLSHCALIGKATDGRSIYKLWG